MANTHMVRKFINLCMILCLICLFCQITQIAKAEEPETQKQFFSLETELTQEQKEDTSKNYFYKASAEQEIQTESTGVLHFFFTGTSFDIMNRITIEEEKKSITIIFPDSEYLLEQNEFTEWDDMLSKMKVTTREDGAVVIKISTKKEMDSYSIFENSTFEFCLTYDIDFFIPDSYKTLGMILLKPEDVTIHSVTNEDLYEKRRFIITIEGDYTDFYERNPIIENSNQIEQIEVEEEDGDTIITVDTSSLQGYKIYEKENFLVVKMGTPRKIYSSIVVLDAGHGGKDDGASANGMKEKNLNYRIIYTLMKSYFSGNAPDIKVYWTRKTDTFITLSDRAAFAKKMGADVFISLHMNMAGNKSANGTEVYYSTSNNSAKFDGITSKKMAALFKNRLVSDLNTKDRGVKSAGFYVIKHNTVPAILIELGFISGNKDSKKLKTESFQKKAAKAIYVGIVQMFLNYDTGR